jgi:hypothetical protein
MKRSHHFHRYWFVALLAAFGMILSGCGGGNSSGNGSNVTTSNLSGTAATGVAMAGFVYVTGANGSEINVAINSNGSFSADVSGMTSPFMLRAVPNDTALPVQYSYAASANVTVNVTPLTTLALFLANNQQDLAAVSGSQIDATALASAMAVVRSNFTAQFTAQGLDAASYDFFASAFAANGSGFDAVLDAVGVSVDMSAGSFAVTVDGVDFTFDPNTGGAGGGGSGGGGSGGGGSTGGSSIGTHPGGITVPISIVTLVGSYDVAIYRVPAGQESLIGPSKVVIAETDGVKSIELTQTDGTVITHVDTSFPYLDPATSFQMGSSQITGVNGTDIGNYMVAQFGSDGTVIGHAGGFGQIGFRNNMNAYNTTVPAVFTALAGTWSGPAQALTCSQPDVTVTITEAGQVSMNGTPNLSCATGTVVTATWDGNDDYIIPLSTGGYQLGLDVIRGGGSTDGGGIYLTIDDPVSPASISNAKTVLSGVGGNIESSSLTRGSSGSGSGDGGASGFGSLTLGGGASSTAPVVGGPLPTSFTPTASSTGGVVNQLYWDQGVNTNLVVSNNSVQLVQGSSIWSAGIVSGGLPAAGVTLDLAAGTVAFSNVSLAPLSWASGTVILDGTLNLSAPLGGSALTFSGTGTAEAGSGMDAPAATVSTSAVIDNYSWQSAQGVIVYVADVHTNGLKSVQINTPAGPLFFNGNAGAAVSIDTAAKTVTFNNLTVPGQSPTTTSLTLNGVLTLP